METRLIVADMPIHEKPARVSVLTRNGRPAEIDVSFIGSESKLDNIYVGHIESRSDTTGGFFVRFSEGETGYLPFKDAENAVIKYAGKDRQLKPESELLVQVVTDAVKTKRPRLSANLSVKGRYVVAGTDAQGIFFSKKLSAETKEELKAVLSDASLSDRFSYVIRTNAASAAREELTADVNGLTEKLEYITRIGVSRPWGTCLYRRKNPWTEMLARSASEEGFRITTDDAEVYEELRLYIEDNHPELSGRLSFYSDSMVELYRLHKFSTLLDHCTSEKVWLPSGASIVIQQTEAFVCIDVNTGKLVKKTFRKEDFHKVNMEAAKEIAAQIRLRNLSGTILVDFINMTAKGQEEELLEEMSAGFASDPVKTNVVDITKLGIMEITRRKSRKSLKEQLQG